MFPEENKSNYIPLSRVYISVYYHCYNFGTSTEVSIEIDKFLQTTQEGFYASQNKFFKVFLYFSLYPVIEKQPFVFVDTELSMTNKKFKQPYYFRFLTK